MFPVSVLPSPLSPTSHQQRNARGVVCLLGLGNRRTPGAQIAGPSSRIAEVHAPQVKAAVIWTWAAWAFGSVWLEANHQAKLVHACHGNQEHPRMVGKMTVHNAWRATPFEHSKPRPCNDDNQVPCVCVRMSFDVSAGQMLSCLQLAPQLSFRTPIAILYILGKLEKHTLRLIATNPS